MNWKTLISQLALVAFAFSASAALSQESLIITGKRTNGTIFYREVSPSVEGLYLYNRQLTEIALPEGLTSLKNLDLSDNQLTEIILPSGLMSLEDLDLYGNRLTSLSLLADLTSLKGLWLCNNQLISFDLPSGLTNLERLGLDNNQLTEITLPSGLTSLKDLYLDKNSLTSLDLPPGLSNLEELQLDDNPLTSLSLPAGMMSLKKLWLPGFPLTLLVPDEMNIDNLELHGFSKENIIRYVPDSVFLGLVIRREEDGRVAIVISGGVLQAAEDVFEEWKDVLNAMSPFYINPAESTQRFFRVRFAR